MPWGWEPDFFLAFIKDFLYSYYNYAYLSISQ